MAKLPDATVLGERQKPEPMGRGFHLAEIHSEAQGRAGLHLGEAVAGASDAVFKVQDELQRAREASQLSDVLGKASAELGLKTLEFQRDQDFTTAPDRFKAAATDIGNKYAGEVTTPLAQEAFKREYGRLALSHHLNVMTSAARQEGDYNVAQLDSNLDVYAKQAANAQNPLERDTIMNQARLAIASQRKAGWITDVDAEKRQRVFDSKLEHASVLRDIGIDPKSTAEKLATDPGYASNLDPLSRQQLQHTALVREQQSKALAQPIEARKDAEQAMTTVTSPAAGTLPASYNPEDVGSFVGDKRRLSDADKLQILRQQLTDPARDQTADAELRREISGLEAKAGKAPSTEAAKPDRITATDVRANLGKWVANAEAAAEKRHPGDSVYRDLVVGRVKNYVATIVAAQEGEQKQAYTGLIGTLAGVDGGSKPTTQDDLFARPGAREAYSKLEPQQQAAILTHLNYNANEATGKPAQVNARLVNSIFPRLFLDPSDPKAIYQPQQLAQFVDQGLTPEGHSLLARKIEELKNPDGKGFAADVERVNRTAHAMLTRSIMGSLQPDLAEEAALRFRNELDQKIEQYRKQGKGSELRSLITPGTPDYVLAPARVASYLPSGKQAVYDAAKTATGGEVPPVASMPKLDVANPQKSFDDLKPGSWFVAPDGRVGRKPGEPAAAAAPKAPAYEGYVERQIGQIEPHRPHSPEFYTINAPVRTPARALAGKKFDTREQALEALRGIYEGAK